MELRVIVVTSDRYLWALKPFSYLFNQFWGEKQPVLVAGYNPPTWRLPPNFAFHSISKHDYPQEKWSNAFIELLNSIPDEYFVLMLEDYWLTRQVDTNAVDVFHKFMAQTGDIVRFDLTNDRLHAKGDCRNAQEIPPIDHYDIVYTPPDTPYQMSFQAAIWSRGLLLQVLEPDKSPWEVELHTQFPPDFGVVGSRQWPVRYANAIRKGAIDEDQLKMIRQPYMAKVREWIPDDFNVEVP